MFEHVDLGNMDIGPVVPEHMVDELVVPEQKDFAPAVLGKKVDTLVALGRRGFVPGVLG